MIKTFLAVYGWIIAGLLLALWQHAEYQLRQALTREANCLHLLADVDQRLQPSLAALRASKVIAPLLLLGVFLAACSSPTSPDRYELAWEFIPPGCHPEPLEKPKVPPTGIVIVGSGAYAVYIVEDGTLTATFKAFGPIYGLCSWTKGA